MYAGHVWLVCAFDFSVALNGFMAGHKRGEEETYAERMLSFSLHIQGGGCWSTREVLVRCLLDQAWHDSGKNATRILSTTS